MVSFQVITVRDAQAATETKEDAMEGIETPNDDSASLQNENANQILDEESNHSTVRKSQIEYTNELEKRQGRY
jgi:hypothetical protein